MRLSERCCRYDKNDAPRHGSLHPALVVRPRQPLSENLILSLILSSLLIGSLAAWLMLAAF